MKLPQYGIMSEKYIRIAEPKPMGDWEPDCSRDVREANFLKWINAYRDQIAEVIWPIWNNKDGAWIGTAAAFADDLTKRELELLVEHTGSGKRFDLAANPSIGDTLVRNSHKWHFREEDDDQKVFGVNFRYYYNMLTVEQEERVLKIWDEVESGKADGFFYLKAELQRPRPYQAAAIFRISDFKHQFAESAQHPTGYCGHCLDGLLVCCTLAEMWKLNPPDSSNFWEKALMQYGIDIGDRRVFAGVHFPTDNMVSWSLLLDVIPYLFKNQNYVTGFALDAITNHGAVYRHVTSEYKDDKFLGGAYSLLQRAIERATRRVSSGDRHLVDTRYGSRIRQDRRRKPHFL